MRASTITNCGVCGDGPGRYRIWRFNRPDLEVYYTELTGGRRGPHSVVREGYVVAKLDYEPPCQRGDDVRLADYVPELSAPEAHVIAVGQKMAGPDKGRWYVQIGFDGRLSGISLA